MSSDSPPFVSARSVCKRYANERLEALQSVSFSIKAGEKVAIMGPSGCGKSTLLSILGALDKPTSGEVVIDNSVLTTGADGFHFRARTIGFVFQFHHLIPSMTLLENVEAPMFPLGVPKRERRSRALHLLSKVGLEDLTGSFPARVSGGERQRAAVARALVNEPRLILADEPTGNLDSATGAIVADLILNYSVNQHTTVIVATHNVDIANLCDRKITMRDGRITN